MCSCFARYAGTTSTIRRQINNSPRQTPHYDSQAKTPVSLGRELLLQRLQQLPKQKRCFIPPPIRYKLQLVALNFSDQEQTVAFTFPFTGKYIDELPGYENLDQIASGEVRAINVHSNYGRICTLKQN